MEELGEAAKANPGKSIRTASHPSFPPSLPPSLLSFLQAAIHIRLAALSYEEGGREEGMEELGEAAKANPGKGDAVAFWLRGMFWKREGRGEGGREKQVVQSWGKAREARPTCGLLRRLVEGEGGGEGGDGGWGGK